jgi:hypothetical protein
MDMSFVALVIPQASQFPDGASRFRDQNLLSLSSIIATWSRSHAGSLLWGGSEVAVSGHRQSTVPGRLLDLFIFEVSGAFS